MTYSTQGSPHVNHLELIAPAVGMLSLAIALVLASTGLFVSDRARFQVDTATQSAAPGELTVFAITPASEPSAPGVRPVGFAQSAAPGVLTAFAVPPAWQVFGPGAAPVRSSESKDYERYMVDGHVQTF
jgi:hypothetical protein